MEILILEEMILNQLLVEVIGQSKFFAEQDFKPILKSYLKKKAEQLKIQLSNLWKQGNIFLQVGQEAVIFSGLSQKDFSKIISPFWGKNKNFILKSFTLALSNYQKKWRI